MNNTEYRSKLEKMLRELQQEILETGGPLLKPEMARQIYDPLKSTYEEDISSLNVIKKMTEFRTVLMVYMKLFPDTISIYSRYLDIVDNQINDLAYTIATGLRELKRV